MSTHYSASVSDAGDNESRAHEPRRAAYLSNVAERTVGGITRFGHGKTPVAVVA